MQVLDRRFIGVAVLAAAGAPLLAGLGPSLPGPPVRTWLGLAETNDPHCRPETSRVRSPATPAPPKGSWRREQASPLARVELDAAVVGGQIYTVGGQGRNGSVAAVLTYDPATRRYRRAADLPEPLDHLAAVSRGGDLYVAGGLSDAQPRPGLWRYSPRTRRWTELAPMRVPRGGHAAAVIGDRLYVVGGAPPAFPNEHVEPYATLEVYHFRTDRWSAAPDMPTARHHLAAVALDGKFYAIGGHAPHDFSLPAFERFDPARGEWERLPPLPLGVRDLDAVAVRGEIVVTGGDDEEGRGWVTPAVWSFHPRRGSWRRLPDLRTARHGHASATHGDRVFVLEGSGCAGFYRMRGAESLRARPPTQPAASGVTAARRSRSLRLAP